MWDFHLTLNDASVHLLAEAPDCIKMLSATGQICFINAFGLALLGASSGEQVAGKYYMDLWPAAMHEAIHEALTGALSGQHTTVEGFRSTLKGTWRWWEAHFHGVDGKDGERAIICIARDLTERRARETELQAANERLSEQLASAELRKVEFISTLAHELRNPLASVMSGLHVLRESVDDRAAAETVRGIIERQVTQLVRLTNDLLDIARVSSGRLEMQKAQVDLKTVIMEAVEATAPLMASLKHKLSVAIPEIPISVFADSARLIQAFSNLLNNAAKYTKSGGDIAITSKKEDDMVVVSVTDSGIGLQKDDVERIFQMFNSVGSNTARSNEGLGIGLNLVRQLVELHQGTVTAHSDGLDLGSTFTVTLPISHVPAASKDEAALSRHDKEVRILVVDDNVDAATTLAMLLDYDDHVIQVANCGQEALRAVASFRPDIAFLDIGMPEMDGYQVARAVRAMPDAANLMLVALTGWGGQRDRERTKAAGFDGHLTKPADLASIEAMLFRVKEADGVGKSRHD